MSNDLKILMDMRKYKFRGKSTDTKEWLVGALVPNGKHPCIAQILPASAKLGNKFEELGDRG